MTVYSAVSLLLPSGVKSRGGGRFVSTTRAQLARQDRQPVTHSSGQ